MNQFSINDEERKRILNLHENATKRQYLKEQSNTIKYGNCVGKVPVSDASGMIRTIEKSGNRYTAEFSLTAYFSATESTDEGYRSALSKLKKSIDAQIKKRGLENEGLQFAKIINISDIEGSASNYLGGSLKPTNDKYGKPFSTEALEQPPYDSLPGKGSPDWDKNLGYANSRWSSMVNFIINNGDSVGFKVNPNVKPENIISIIRDTGGYIDEKRDTKNYPAAGQYVKVQGTVQLTKGEEEEPEEDIISCADGLKIIIGYFPESINLAGIEFKNSRSSHTCNYATYDIFLNGVKIGISNMNNDKGNRRIFDSREASLGKDEPGYRGPIRSGARVYTIFDVPSSEIEEIAKRSESGEITISMQGTDGALRKNGEMHGDAPLVCAIVEEEDGNNRVVYGPKEPFKNNSGFNKPTFRELGTFDPCNEVRVIPKI